MFKNYVVVNVQLCESWKRYAIVYIKLKTVFNCIDLEISTKSYKSFTLIKYDIYGVNETIISRVNLVTTASVYNHEFIQKIMTFLHKSVCVTARACVKFRLFFVRFWCSKALVWTFPVNHNHCHLISISLIDVIEEVKEFHSKLKNSMATIEIEIAFGKLDRWTIYDSTIVCDWNKCYKINKSSTDFLQITICIEITEFIHRHFRFRFHLSAMPFLFFAEYLPNDARGQVPILFKAIGCLL